MQAREWRFDDKSEWGPGPWQDEPDKMQWVDEATGLPCLVVRNNGGALCGYVGVPEGHPWFAQHWDGPIAKVHGGITFAGFCQQGKEEHTVCHVVEPGENDRVWWLGFDCSHAYDLRPADAARLAHLNLSWPTIPGETYRDLSYVRAEVASLARQAVDDPRCEPRSEDNDE